VVVGVTQNLLSGISFRPEQTTPSFPGWVAANLVHRGGRGGGGGERNDGLVTNLAKRKNRLALVLRFSFPPCAHARRRRLKFTCSG